jgi:hypothetical protein
VTCRVLEAEEKHVSFDAASDAHALLREYSEQHEKAGKFQASCGHNVCSDVEMKKRDFSKLKQRPGNIYENKGLAFHDLQGSGNVYENTGT